jgi:DNA-binding transcriptional regulator YbjK
MDTAAAPTGSRGESRLLVAAHEVVLEQGLAGASARAIAQRAGSSASAIHYHFESVEALIAAALNHARERDREWRRGLLDGFARSELGPELLPYFLMGVTSTAAGNFRELTLLRWDTALETALRGRFAPVATAWRDDLTEFWSAVLHAFGVAASPRLIAELADAASRIYLAVGNGPTHVAWVTETIAHFAARLCGVELARRGRTIWRDLHRIAPAEDKKYQQKRNNPRAARIVEAAVNILLAQGPHAVTHRAVATLADVSLSSTTYYFESRGEILHAAFSELRADAITRAHASAAEPTTRLSLDLLLERMGDALVPTPREISRKYIASQSLQHAAVRDAQLRPHAQQLYASMGEATLRLFRQTPELREPDNALAAFTFALWTDAMLCNLSLENADSVASEVRARQREMLALLFELELASDSVLMS